MNIRVNNNDYTLTKPLVKRRKTIELHFAEYNSEIDFSNGFILYPELENFDAYHENYSNYNKKWNVITELEDGIVLTNTNEVETEDDRLAPFPECPEDIIPSLEDRIRDLEAAICELAEGV